MSSKQVDNVVTDKKHYSSKAAEASDHFRSDANHLVVVADRLLCGVEKWVHFCQKKRAMIVSASTSCAADRIFYECVTCVWHRVNQISFSFANSPLSHSDDVINGRKRQSLQVGGVRHRHLRQ